MNKLIALCALSTSLCASELTPPNYTQDTSFAVVEKTNPEQAAHDTWLALLDAQDTAGLVEHARQAIRKEDIYEAYGTLTIAAALDKTGDAACELARRLTDDERCALDFRRLNKFISSYHYRVKDYFKKYLRVAAGRKNPQAVEMLEVVAGEKALSFYKSDSVEDFAKILRARKDQTASMLNAAAGNHINGTLDIEQNILHYLGFASLLCHAHPTSHHGPQFFLNWTDTRSRSCNSSIYSIQTSQPYLLTYTRQIYERSKTAQTAYQLAVALTKEESEYEDLLIESYNLNNNGPAKDLAKPIIKKRKEAFERKEKEVHSVELESQGQASSSSGFPLNLFSRK